MGAAAVSSFAEVRARNQWDALRGQLHTRFAEWRDALAAQRQEPAPASSNKFICHVRLKRSGTWGYEINSNQMLALRCAQYTGTFDPVLARPQQRLRKA